MGKQLYIGGISSATTEESLKEWLAANGLTVSAVHLVRNMSTGLGRGFAFAEFHDEGAVLDAIRVLAGLSVDGCVPTYQTVPDRQTHA